MGGEGALSPSVCWQGGRRCGRVQCAPVCRGRHHDGMPAPVPPPVGTGATPWSDPRVGSDPRVIPNSPIGCYDWLLLVGPHTSPKRGRAALPSKPPPYKSCPAALPCDALAGGRSMGQKLPTRLLSAAQPQQEPPPPRTSWHMPGRHPHPAARPTSPPCSPLQQRRGPRLQRPRLPSAHHAHPAVRRQLPLGPPSHPMLETTAPACSTRLAGRRAARRAQTIHTHATCGSAYVDDSKLWEGAGRGAVSTTPSRRLAAPPHHHPCSPWDPPQGSCRPAAGCGLPSEGGRALWEGAAQLQQAGKGVSKVLQGGGGGCGGGRRQGQAVQRAEGRVTAAVKQQ